MIFVWIVFADKKPDMEIGKKITSKPPTTLIKLRTKSERVLKLKLNADKTLKDENISSLEKHVILD